MSRWTRLRQSNAKRERLVLPRRPRRAHPPRHRPRTRSDPLPLLLRLISRHGPLRLPRVRLQLRLQLQLQLSRLAQRPPPNKHQQPKSCHRPLLLLPARRCSPPTRRSRKRCRRRTKPVSAVGDPPRAALLTRHRRKQAQEPARLAWRLANRGCAAIARPHAARSRGCIVQQ